MLFLWTAALAVVCYQGEGVSAGASKNSLKGLKSWAKKMTVGWKKMTNAGRIDEAKQLPDDYNDGPAVQIQSSLMSEEELKYAGLLLSRQSSSSILAANSSSACSCSDSPRCSVTCSSLECHCGRTCTHVTEFSGKYYSSNFVILVSTIVSTYSVGCEEMVSACATRAVVGAAAVAAAVAAAIAVGVAVPVGVVQAAQAASVAREARTISQSVGQFLANGGLFDSRTPINNLPLPVNLTDRRDDGCGDASVRFRDGNCYPVLRRGPCSSLNWITVDPDNFTV